MHFLVTSAFANAYDALSGEMVHAVDEAILRLLDEHEGAWARRGRVAGEGGEAWILEIRPKRADISLYWNYLEDERLVLLLLLVRRA